MSGIFDYKPIQEWNENVVNFGLPTIEGNRKISEIVTSALNAEDATVRCYELSLSSDLFGDAVAPDTLKLVRLFFTGDGAELEQLQIFIAESFIESFVGGFGVSTTTELLDLIDTDDNTYLNITTKTVQRYDIEINKSTFAYSSLNNPFNLRIIYTPIIAPSGLNASDADLLNPGVVIVDWDIMPDSVSYNVYRSTKKNAFDFFVADDLSADQTLIGNSLSNQFYDTSLTNIGTYFYWVASLFIDSNGRGECLGDSTYDNDQVGCETIRGVWTTTTTGVPPDEVEVSSCSDPLWTTQISCESPYGTWDPLVLQGLLAPDLIRCSSIEGCSLGEFTNQYVCETALTCLDIATNTEVVTSRKNDPLTWIPAFDNETKCELRPNPNDSNSTGCYYSTNPTNGWIWSNANVSSPGEYGCTTTFASGNPELFYIWFVAGDNIWSGDSGNWYWNWSPELCQSSGGIWTFSHPGEEGSIPGDPYIELVENFVATEGEFFQITLQWDSNPTVDPLIGTCYECLDLNDIKLTDDSELECLKHGTCSDHGLTSTRYTGYVVDDFDNDFGWFETATISTFGTTIIPIVDYYDTDEYFARRIHGYFIPSVSGNHKFRTKSDDSSWMWIGYAGENIDDLTARRSNTNEIIDNSGSHPAQTVTSANINLVAGKLYPILIYYGQGYGGAMLEMQYDPPNSGWTFGNADDFRTIISQADCIDPTNGFCDDATRLTEYTCEGEYCSDSFGNDISGIWSTSQDCVGAGTCVNAAGNATTYDNDQGACLANGICLIQYCESQFFGSCLSWSAYTISDNNTVGDCLAADGTYTNTLWYPNTWESDNNVWNLPSTWNLHTWTGDGNQWVIDDALYQDASSCVVNNSTWIPDPTIQNTPDSYNVYRATEPEHLLTPSEYHFIANVTHDSEILEQVHIDTDSKTKFALYYYKITQIAGGVESDFCLFDTGWENH
jgi:hypothetical protein